MRLALPSEFFFFFFFEPIYIPAYKPKAKPGRSYEPLHLETKVNYRVAHDKCPNQQKRR
jgi:hypothetical protein